MAALEERHAQERCDFQRGEILGVYARVGDRIAHNDHVACTRLLQEFIPHKFLQTMNTDQAGHILAMPVMVDHRLFCRFVDFDERTERKLQLRGQLGADDLHQCVHTRPLNKVAAERRQKLEIQLCLLALSHVA